LFWANDQSLALKRWLLIFVPGILMALLAAADERPERSFTLVKWLFVAITIASYVFSLNIYAFGEITGVGDLMRFRIIDLGGMTIGVSEGGRKDLGLDIQFHRFSGFTSNPNGFALFAGLSAIVLCATLKWRSTPRGCFEGVALVLIVIILVMSASRAAVAMALTGIVMIILLRTKHRKLARLSVIGVVGLACLLFLWAWLRSESPIDPGEGIYALRGRTDVWALVLAAIGDEWLSGVGFGLTQEVVFGPLGLESSGHSIPLSLLLETGAVGLLLLLVTWFFPVLCLTRKNRHLDDISVGIVALLVALFVHQIADSSVFRYHWAHFVFVYLIGASSHLAARGRD
jgi:hypothetical protein